RVHTVGIDQAVNAGFLGRLAAAGAGRCELVESEDRLDAAMDRIHRRIATPLVAELQLAAEGLDIDPDTISPARMPDLFEGAPVRIMGRYRGTPGGAIATRGRRADGSPWSARVTASISGSPALTAVWARGRLRDLEDRYTAGGVGVGLGPAQDERESLEHTIVQTSLRYGVLCRFTAYVAVDSRAAAEGTPPHRVTQPVETPAGWRTLSAVTPLGLGATSPVARSAPGAPAPAAPTGPVSGAGGGFGMQAASFAPAAIGVPLWSGHGPAGQSRGEPLNEARAQLAIELERLSALSRASLADRRDALADLGSRLAALARHLDDAGVAAREWEPLAQLADELAVCDSPSVGQHELQRLWRRAVEALTSFGDQPDDAHPTRGVEEPPQKGNPTKRKPRARAAFWKRG
ncbi:MAG: VIT domain-containing protein, partial [Micromonosporaceae bacterium]